MHYVAYIANNNMVAQHEQNNYEREREIERESERIKNAHTHQTNDSNMMRQSLTGRKKREMVE